MSNPDNPRVASRPNQPVILADDDFEFRTAFHRGLARAGFQVYDAVNGHEVLHVFQEHPDAIVVLDLVMPEKEGIETMFELRRKNPRVKIIAISGGGRGSAQDYLALAANLGARDALEKPFALDVLVDALNAASHDVAP